jgi:hypothetical protein
MLSRDAIPWIILISYGFLFSLLINLFISLKKSVKNGVVMGILLSLVYIAVSTFVCELFYGIR